MTIRNTMFGIPMNPIWEDPDWLSEVRLWVERSLAARSTEVEPGEDQFHIRPWSTVIRFKSTCGNVMFKACFKDWKHEAGVTAVISRFAGSRSPRLFAHDPSLNYLLMAEEGEPIRKVQDNAERWRLCAEAMPGYAGLQIDLAPHTSELVTAGCPDYRLQRLPELYNSFLEDRSLRLRNLPGAFTTKEYRELVSRRGDFEDIVSELASLGIPETIQHDDLHDNNLLYLKGVDADERFKYFDWGDSCVSHPFLSMYIVLANVGSATGDSIAASARHSIARSYLKAWSHVASEADLHRALMLALEIAPLCRALTWSRLLPALDPHQTSEFACQPAVWARRYLNRMLPIE